MAGPTLYLSGRLVSLTLLRFEFSPAMVRILPTEANNDAVSAAHHKSKEVCVPEYQSDVHQLPLPASAAQIRRLQ